MYPVLLKVGRVAFYTYGLCIAAGVLAGMFYLRSKAPRYGLTVKRVYDLVFFMFISGLLGGRLLFVAMNLRRFDSFFDVFKVWEGGLVFYGGFAASLATFFILMKVWKVRIPAVLDVLGPTGALIHAIGRLGCFFAGCCYGYETGLPWGVIFSNPQSLAPLGIRIHPTQVYASLGNAVIFVILHRRLGKKLFDGEVFLWYMIGYGMLRFFNEFLRADPRGPVVLMLTGMQHMSLAIGLTGLCLLVMKRRTLAPPEADKRQ